MLAAYIHMSKLVCQSFNRKTYLTKHRSFLNSIKSVLNIVLSTSKNDCRSLPEAVMTMVPEAWQNDPLMPDYKKDFYRLSF
jgi:glutamate synthase domain-containing protein 1